jgi:hypothetical protein
MRHDSHSGFSMAAASIPLLRVNPIMLARSLRFGARNSLFPRASTIPERVRGLKPHIGEVTAESGARGALSSLKPPNVHHEV